MVDDQLELGRLRDREFCGLGAFEDAAGRDADLTIRIQDVARVAHQPADLSKVTRRKRRGNRMTHRQVGKLHPPADEKAVPSYEKRVGPPACKTRERCIEGWCWR